MVFKIIKQCIYAFVFLVLFAIALIFLPFALLWLTVTSLFTHDWHWVKEVFLNHPPRDRLHINVEYRVDWDTVDWDYWAAQRQLYNWNDVTSSNVDWKKNGF